MGSLITIHGRSFSGSMWILRLLLATNSPSVTSTSMSTIPCQLSARGDACSLLGYLSS
ncbi:MAG: IPT/TIG domain-containing protein [Thermoplasmatota archaeon]